MEDLDDIINNNYDENEEHFEIIQSSDKIDEIDEPTNFLIKNRKTTPLLTHYEKARILGTRAQQLSVGALSHIQFQVPFNPLLVAQQELAEDCIPLIIRRYLSDGSYEDWSVSELIK